MKFRKKPIIVEALQYRGVGKSFPGVCHGGGRPQYCGNDFPHIHTLEGLMKVRKGDWIITGIKGEHYPCKPDIFEATYEPAE